VQNEFVIEIQDASETSLKCDTDNERSRWQNEFNKIQDAIEISMKSDEDVSERHL